MPVQYLHRTAAFALHHPTRHIRAVLEHAFATYSAAYTALLYHFAPYTVAELQAMATYGQDDRGQPRQNARRLEQALFAGRDLPAGVTAPLATLESGLRESLRRHVAETLMSYVTLSDQAERAAQANPASPASGEHTSDEEDRPDPSREFAPASFTGRGRATMAPAFPRRLRAIDREPARRTALAGLAELADNLARENELRNELLRTAQPDAVPLTFCRIEAGRNCGLFYNPETRTFYARLFVVPLRSRHARPITIAGRYVDLRTGQVYMREEDAREASPEGSVLSFGTGTRSILVPLELGRWHEERLRFTAVAFLPQRHAAPGVQEIQPAEPVSAKLVKHGASYRLHVAFRLPKPESLPVAALLGINRGITNLVAGAVMSLDGRRQIAAFTTSGEELGRLQQAIEQAQKVRQQQGRVKRGDRRRVRIADHYVHLCANQIVELAQQHRAQVLAEDFSAFATPGAHPGSPTDASRKPALRRLLPRRQYQKLLEAIDARLTLVGLPSVRVVPSAFISLTCTACGHISPENRSREDRTRFRCVACGFEAASDELAGVNVARKLIWLARRASEKKAGIPMDARTPWQVFAGEYVGHGEHV